VSGKAASAFWSPAFVGRPSISVNEFCGRGNVASNALWLMTTPPSSSAMRGGWKKPTTRSDNGSPDGESRTNWSPSARLFFFANDSFTIAPPPESSFSVAADEPRVHLKL
jgi:hypothetical protein